MKKTLILTIATSVAALGAFAQGQWQFSAGASTGKISYSTDKVTIAAAVPKGGVVPGGYGAVNIAFMGAANGTVLTVVNGLPNFTTAWTEFGPTVTAITPIAGQASSGTINMPTSGSFSVTPGSSFELEVVGWTGTATSWAQAVATMTPLTLLGYAGSTLSGGAVGWSQGTGNPNALPVAGTPSPVVTGTGGYTGLVLTPVPEPTTIALGSLGAAALLLFRRRK